ncbi:MAG: hypothetical protein M3126_04580 [Candidatus Eremiobacteraeota bacterium]|nr:hypothetical protein [Candidatus Eremiobacteraeota bacterium]
MLFAAAGVLQGRAGAQAPLPRLHVTTLSLRADTLHPQIERPFHLIITAHFKEQLANVDFVVLPNLAELEDLGDERHTLGGPKGTDFTETITVVAHHSGKLRVAPVYFNAIDARDRKPKTFSSNELLLTVEGGALENPLAGLRSAASAFFKWLAILFAAGVVALIFIKRRTRTEPPAATAVIAPEPVAVRSSLDVLREQLSALRAKPSRHTVFSVRRTLWAMAGAGEGETLADVLARLHGREPALHPVLRLTERAAFIQDAFAHGAIDDMIAALEHYLA